MSLFWKSFLWALAACLASMGTVLLSNYTISARVSAPEISRMDECLLGGSNWGCVGEHSSTTAIDPGAISWQEFPTHGYFNKYKFESKPLWNPYIGSGYPVFLDGIFRPMSLIRQFLVFMPTDQGRDVVTFFRFFIWTWGILFSAMILGVRGSIYLFFVGVAATMLPYMQKYLDIIFLDVEMAVPWVYALTLYAAKFDSKKSAIGLGILGVWVGSQSFIQAQVVFLLVSAIIVVLSSIAYKKKLFVPFFCFFAMFFVFGFYNIFEFKSFFSELVSNRSFVGCVSTHGLSWQDVWINSFVGITKRAEMNTLFALSGIPFLFYGIIKSRETLYLTLLYVLLLTWIIMGSPQITCSVVGLNAIHFWRHLVPYLQSLFLIISAVSVYILASNFKRKKIILCVGFLFAIVPGSNRTMISVEHIRGKFPKEYEYEFKKIPEGSVFSAVQQLSREKDLRHFSPDYRLYPNYSAAFGILDMRVLYGSYPKRIFALNDGLFNNWHETPFYKHADRFVTVEKPDLNFPSSDFEKMMLIHRVSMVTLSVKNTSLKRGIIYNTKNCRLEKSDILSALYICPFVGGVGFFPTRVDQVEGEEEALSVLKKIDINRVLNYAVIEGKKHDDIGAEGEIQSVLREKDRTTYKLKVNREGYFVYSDTYFPGWHAEINGAETEIYPANIGFKAVWLSAGDINLTWYFRKN